MANRYGIAAKGFLITDRGRERVESRASRDSTERVESRGIVERKSREKRELGLTA